MLDSILQGVVRSPPNSKRWAAVEAPELPYALPVQSGLLIVSPGRVARGCALLLRTGWLG